MESSFTNLDFLERRWFPTLAKPPFIEPQNSLFSVAISIISQGEVLKILHFLEEKTGMVQKSRRWLTSWYWRRSHDFCTGFYLYIPGGYIVGFLNHQQYVKNMVEIWFCLCVAVFQKLPVTINLPGSCVGFIFLFPFIKKIHRNIFLGTDQGMVDTYHENCLVF